VESYRTEEEQLEALKRWWSENGRSIVITVVLTLSAVLGWQAWQGRQQQVAEGAALLYEQMLARMSTAQGEQNSTGVEQLARQLKEDYGSGVYARFAALHLARLAVERGDLQAAAEELRWVIERAEAASELAAVARLRLARVLAAQGETESALQILAERTVSGFAGAYAAARGDILLAAGRRDEAREAYLAAQMDASGVGGAQLLTQKLQHLQAESAVAPVLEP
jgi:predicted negative regulator of RcsB-dependent stress response